MMQSYLDLLDSTEQEQLNVIFESELLTFRSDNLEFFRMDMFDLEPTVSFSKLRCTISSSLVIVFDNLSV
jgi:hypothetical protein